MAMVVKNNMQAKNTLNTLNKNEKSASKAMKKLGTGMKINSAADDASGLSIAERMGVQMRGLDQDNANVQNGTAMMKTAEGSVSSTIDILTTLKEKAINAANDTNTDSDRATMQKEFDQLIDQLDDNANIQYNGQQLLDGSQNHFVAEPGTQTCLVNMHFSQDTDAVYSPVTDMVDSSGQSLGIQSTDKVTLSYVKNGVTYEKSVDPLEDLCLNDMFDSLTMNPDGSLGDILSQGFTDEVGTDRTGETKMVPGGLQGVVLQARDPGTAGQIAGITICFTRPDGSQNKAANQVFNDFHEEIRAEIPSDDNAVVLQSGTKANQSVKASLSDMRSTGLGLKGFDGNYLSISDQKSANAAINVLESALQKALDQMTDIGAVNSRLEYTSANVTLSSNNVQASMSTIQDADMAAEMTEYTKHNVLLQASQSMLSQANQNSSSVLSLLQ